MEYKTFHAGSSEYSLEIICATSVIFTCPAPGFDLRLSSRRCFKCNAPLTDDCVRVDRDSRVLGNNDPVEDCLSITPTAVLLLRNLKKGVTEEKVDEGLRTYAQVKALRLHANPLGGSEGLNPIAFAEFHSIQYAMHVMAATAKVPGAALINESGEVTSSSVEIAGGKARIYYAKPSAMFLTALVPKGLPPGYNPAQQRLQQSQQYLAMQNNVTNGFEMAQSVLASVNDRMGKLTGVALPGAVGATSSNESLINGELSSAVQERIRRKTENGGSSEWPPSFEDDSLAWVFDASSGYFLHAATQMYYEPKSRWYCRREDNKYVYYYHQKGHEPPYVERKATVSSASASTEAAQTGPESNAKTSEAPSAVVAHSATAVPTVTSMSATNKKPVSFGLSLGGPGAKSKSRGGPSLTSKKISKDINKWGARAREESDEDESNESSTTDDLKSKRESEQRKRETSEAMSLSDAKAQADAAAAAASTAALLAASPAATLLGLDSQNLTGGADFKVLGLDYSSLGRLRLDGGPLVERGSGGKWACLVSRRVFPTEEKVAQHVRLSKLYKEELSKAIDAGRISFA